MIGNLNFSATGTVVVCDECGARTEGHASFGEAHRAAVAAGWWLGAVNCTTSLELCPTCTKTALSRRASGAR